MECSAKGVFRIFRADGKIVREMSFERISAGIWTMLDFDSANAGNLPAEVRQSGIGSIRR
jgi:hypothetical protein